MKHLLKRFLAVLTVVLMLTALCSPIATSAEENYFRNPISIDYNLEVDDDGYAKGEVTVRVNAWVNMSVCPMEAVMYWADENGPLKGYSALARFEITTVSTTFEFPELQIIPKGADRLRVYTAKKGDTTLSNSFREAMLPEGAACNMEGEPVLRFAVVSDTHVQIAQDNKATQRFKYMLLDLKSVIPDTVGLFINGDVINSSQGNEGIAAQEYASMWNAVDTIWPDLPVYLAVGNHDLWPNAKQDSMKALFLQQAKLPDGTHPETLNYDFWIGGCHFVFLGDDDRDQNYASLSAQTLEWLDKTIAEGYDESHRTFLFLHQSLSNTVAGGITNFGQGAHGVQNVPAVKAVLSKYPNAIMFNGHSHYSMDSVQNAYCVDNYPYSFNTATVWNIDSDGYDESQGYVVEVYNDRVEIKGRNFLTGEWKSSAQYLVAYGELNNLAPEKKPEDKEPEESKTTPKPTTSKKAPDESSSSSAAPEATGGCGSVIGASTLMTAIIPAAVCLVRRKKD